MTGVEQLLACMFAVFCGSVTVCSAVKSWARGRVDVAKEHARAHVEVHRVVAELQHGALTVPPAWTESDS